VIRKLLFVSTVLAVVVPSVLVWLSRPPVDEWSHGFDL